MNKFLKVNLQAAFHWATINKIYRSYIVIKAERRWTTGEQRVRLRASRGSNPVQQRTPHTHTHTHTRYSIQLCPRHRSDLRPLPFVQRLMRTVTNWATVKWTNRLLDKMAWFWYTNRCLKIRVEQHYSWAEIRLILGCNRIIFVVNDTFASEGQDD